MIHEVSTAKTHLSQTPKAADRSGRDAASSGTTPDNSSGFDTRDVVEIAALKPVHPVTEEKGAINQPAGSKDAEKLVKGGEEDQSSGPVKQSELSQEEAVEVEELEMRDREVRRHEQAHMAAAGAHAKGVSFEYAAGPDGRIYAVGGEVSIDTSKVPDDPDATIAKARTIRRAATAPAHPSSQDRQVAAAASRMEAEARMEKLEKASDNGGGETGAAEGYGRASEDPGKIEGSNSPLTDPAASVYGKKESEIGKVLNTIA